MEKDAPLFHENMLRFLLGLKSMGLIINNTSSKGNYNPQSTSVKFNNPDYQLNL